MLYFFSDNQLSVLDHFLMSQPTFHGWDFNVFGVVTHQSFYRIIFAGITCDPQTSKKEIISICLTENCSILSLSKASFRLYILRVCKHYRFLIDYLDLHFKSLILSIFTYAIEVCGGAFYNKYLSRIDKFFNKVLNYDIQKNVILFWMFIWKGPPALGENYVSWQSTSSPLTAT